jgi:catechol 2,3-dioxygenase-like lactoylglutathione lyase family enzyme
MRGLFEAHLDVTDLARSVEFYVMALGLQVARRGDVDGSRADAHSPGARRFALLWIGGPGHAMLGLWERTRQRVLPQHVAFEVGREELPVLAADLVERGVELRDFFQQRTTVPTVFGFIPAASLYFSDPDGHVLELLAPLREPARPELGVVSLSDWRGSSPQGPDGP